MRVSIRNYKYDSDLLIGFEYSWLISTYNHSCQIDKVSNRQILEKNRQNRENNTYKVKKENYSERFNQIRYNSH